jgi:sulfur-carrier protein
MIRVELPANLRILAHVNGEVTLEVAGQATQRSVLDALEALYPMLRGTIRDQASGRRRAYVRFFACEQDLSHESPDAPLPAAVASGTEPLLIVGAIAGGSGPALRKETAPVSGKGLWAGSIISGLTVLFLTFDAVMKVLRLAPAIDATVRLGYPESVVFGLGLVELACTVIYVIPRTSFLGAILLTGYLGGATATHVRIGQPFFFPIVVGLLIWAGLALRDARLRQFLLALLR